MRPLVIAAAALALIGLSPSTSRAEFITGNALYRYCTAEESAATYYQDSTMCIGFIIGVHDGLMTAASYLTYIGEMDPPLRLICTPATVESGQIKDVVVKYLRDNPESRNLEASLLVMTALSDAYPCRST